MPNYDDLLNNAPVAEPNDRQTKEEYAAKKQVEREEVFALSDSTALEIAGDSGRLKQYLDVQSRFDRYSAVNALLILAQKPEATRLAEFDYWKSIGCFVKPGQNAISILEPHEYTKGDGTPGVSYNIRKVFDISQVDARKTKPTQNPLPAYTERQLLAALIAKAPMKISGADTLPNNIGAMTNVETGEITVRKGMEFNDSFRSVARELAFAETKGDKSIDSQFIAYCASYILCKKYGVDTGDYSFDNAPAVFNDMEPQEIKTKLSQIRNAVDGIAGRMAKHLDMAQKAEKVQESR
jgi:hypothetical protein